MARLSTKQKILNTMLRERMRGNRSVTPSKLQVSMREKADKIYEALEELLQEGTIVERESAQSGPGRPASYFYPAFTLEWGKNEQRSLIAVPTQTPNPEVPPATVNWGEELYVESYDDQDSPEAHAAATPEYRYMTCAERIIEGVEQFRSKYSKSPTKDDLRKYVTRGVVDEETFLTVFSRWSSPTYPEYWATHYIGVRHDEKANVLRWNFRTRDPDTFIAEGSPQRLALLYILNRGDDYEAKMQERVDKFGKWDDPDLFTILGLEAVPINQGALDRMHEDGEDPEDPFAGLYPELASKMRAILFSS